MGAAVTPRPLQLGRHLRAGGLILGARVNGLTFEHSARVLPHLAARVPMETKLRKLGGNELLLRFWKRNPNPRTNYLGEVEGMTQTAMNQVENFLSRK